MALETIVNPRLIQKMVIDSSLFSIQHYKVRIKCKVEQSREMSSIFFYTPVL